MAAFRLAAARPEDTPELLAMIRELAQFEHLEHLMANTEAQLTAALFGERPAAEAWLAFPHNEERPAGFALLFQTYSTFLGRPGLWLEDLYVRRQWRHQGCGRALLMHGARLAAERGCGRYEWSVLDWNTHAQRFYESLGATVMPDWRIVRSTSETLAHMAKRDT